MRVALAVNPVSPDMRANRQAILALAEKATAAKADLLLFPEAALTGLCNDDDPAHDLPLGQPVPGPLTEELAAIAREGKMWLGFGLLERDGKKLYDTAVLLSATGEIALKYRRIHPGWHGPRASRAVYGHGDTIPVAETPWGRVAFLICGDLFDNAILRRVRTLSLDLLLYPFARDTYVRPPDAWWAQEELPAYIERVRQLGVTTLMVNYLARDLPDDTTFGSAVIVRGDGTRLAYYPPGRVGLLLGDLPCFP